MKTIRFTLATLIIFFCTLNLWQQNANAQSGTLLYGVAGGGTGDGSGVIFHIDPVTGVQTVDYSLTGAGWGPMCVLAYYNGRFYGVTSLSGGANGFGFIFEWNPAENTFTHKIDFDYSTTGYSWGNSLTLCGDKFYGTTYEGGPSGGGVLYEWDPLTNDFVIKHIFGGSTGNHPWGMNLTQYNGKLYGMTCNGGVPWGGVIFEYDPTTSLYDVKINLGPYSVSNPYGNSLTFYAGKFYANVSSKIFEWDPLTNDFIVRQPEAQPTDGSLTEYGGKFYYLSYYGLYGSIFEWDPVTNINSLEKLFDQSFTGAYGAGSLTEFDGKLYGMTNQGGANNLGVAFEWDPSLDNFNKLLDFNGANGSSPGWTQFTLLNIEPPCDLTAEAGPDVTTYFGIASMQEVTRTAVASGGTPPYSFEWTIGRPLLCNQVNFAGDESFYGGTCTNNTCPTSGSPSDNASCSGSVTINAILLDTATICLTVTDANGCTATDCFTVNASDVRCFSGNGGNQKTKICHHTSSNSNPWVEMCVDDDAVDSHLAHGDYIGPCDFTKSSDPVPEKVMSDSFNLFPNPATDLVTIAFESTTENSYLIVVSDLTGRKLNGFQGKAIQGENTMVINLGGIVRGIYLVKLVLDGKQEVKKLVIE